MYEIYICDDNKLHVNALLGKVKSVINDSSTKYDMRVKCASTKQKDILDEVYKDVNSKKTFNFRNRNIYFLDINFEDDLPGYHLARKIREKDPFGYIIFATAVIRNVQDIPAIGYYEYLSKEITKDDLKRVFEKIDGLTIMETNFLKNRGKSELTLTCGNKVERFDEEEIIVFEANSPKTVIYTESGENETYTSIVKIESMLENKDRFIRVSKTHLVNTDMIIQFVSVKNELILKEGIRVKVSRNKKREIKEIMHKGR